MRPRTRRHSPGSQMFDRCAILKKGRAETLPSQPVHSSEGPPLRERNLVVAGTHAERRKATTPSTFLLC